VAGHRGGSAGAVDHQKSRVVSVGDRHGFLVKNRLSYTGVQIVGVHIVSLYIGGTCFALQGCGAGKVVLTIQDVGG
jgi:hypothetical protein